MDNYGPHVNIPSVLLDMYQHKIILLTYIPHTTHLCQVLDTSIMAAIHHFIAVQLQYTSALAFKINFKPNIAHLLGSIHRGLRRMCTPNAIRNGSFQMACRPQMFPLLKCSLFVRWAERASANGDGGVHQGQKVKECFSRRNRESPVISQPPTQLQTGR